MSQEVTSVVVRMKHIRMAKLCASGTRDWWQRQGLDWMDFLANGIAGQVLLDTGDPLARQAVEAAERDNEQ